MPPTDPITEAMELLPRLNELERFATEAPWHWTEYNKAGKILPRILSPRLEVCNFGSDTDYTPSEGEPPDKGDKALIVELRNALPTIIAALEAYAEREKRVMEFCKQPGPGETLWPNCYVGAKEILAILDGEGGA